MRHSVASKTAQADRRQFAEDVEYYLSQTPRQLPSRYFYDELGSALFEAICRLPWYPITRTEQRLLSMHAHDILARVSPLSTLVELGPGDGGKLMTLLGADASRALTVHLIDVSPDALDAATHAMDDRPEVVVVPHQAMYETGLAEVARHGRSDGRTLVLLLGSNIGNFDPPDSDAFLRTIRAALATRDSLLIGADLVKAERDLLLAYDDPLGVTAAFNRNLLVRANRELGADFDVNGFAHRAVWNAEASRIEMHLVSARRQRVRVPDARLDIIFEAGETIWTESSYKYRPGDIVAMLDRAGFSAADQWTEDGFALTLAEAG
ncbi:MAG: L-histidine N(alpha)-methyltransferase [Acidobacteria bacterium]|nr:L-histidine N(alpha)-methyltransferase [Acidobacteriota bacterium]